MARTGRPPKIDERIVRHILDHVRSGWNLASAGEAIGVSRTSIHRWRHAGALLVGTDLEQLRPHQRLHVELALGLGTPAFKVPPGDAFCVQCASPFVSHHGKAYCSDTCKTQRRIDTIFKMYRLATKTGRVRAGMTFFRTLVEYVADRDGTTCGICHAPVDITLRSGPQGDQAGPSLDHVIPASQGGEDTLANLRLTHWECNRRRGNKGGNEQLRLIG